MNRLPAPVWHFLLAICCLACMSAPTTSARFPRFLNSGSMLMNKLLRNEHVPRVLDTHSVQSFLSASSSTGSRSLLQAPTPSPAVSEEDVEAAEENVRLLGRLTLFQVIGYTLIFFFVIIWLAAVAYLLWGLCDDRQYERKHLANAMSSVTGQSREGVDLRSNEAATATLATGPSAARLGDLASPDGSQMEQNPGSEGPKKQDEATTVESPCSTQGSVTASLPPANMNWQPGEDQANEIQLAERKSAGTNDSDFISAASPGVTEELKHAEDSSTTVKHSKEDGIGSEKEQSERDVPSHKVADAFTQASPKDTEADEHSTGGSTPRSILMKLTHRPAWIKMGRKSKVVPDSGTPASGQSENNKSTQLEPTGLASYRTDDSDALLNSHADPNSADIERESQNPIEDYSEEVCDDNEAPPNKATSPGGRSWRDFIPSGFRSKKNLPKEEKPGQSAGAARRLREPVLEPVPDDYTRNLRDIVAGNTSYKVRDPGSYINEDSQEKGSDDATPRSDPSTFGEHWPGVLPDMRYPDTPTEQLGDSSITDELVSGPGKRSRSELISTAESQGVVGHVRRQVNRYEKEHPGSPVREEATAPVPVVVPTPPTKRLAPPKTTPTPVPVSVPAYESTSAPTSGPYPVPVPLSVAYSAPESASDPRPVPVEVPVQSQKDFSSPDVDMATDKAQPDCDVLPHAGFAVLGGGVRSHSQEKYGRYQGSMDPESTNSSITGPDRYMPNSSAAQGSKEQRGDMGSQEVLLGSHIVPPPAATAVAAFTAGEDSGEDSVKQDQGSRRSRSRRSDRRFSSAALRRNTRAGSVCSSAPSRVPSMSSANSSPVRAPESEGSLLYRSGRTMTPELSTRRSMDSRRSSANSGKAVIAHYISAAAVHEGNQVAATRDKDGGKDAEKEKPPFVCGTTTPKVVHADFETPFEALTSPKRSQTKRKDKALRPRKEPPGANASLNSQMQFIHYQLDCFSDRHNVLNGLSLLRTGPKQRFQSGLSVIQIARSIYDSYEYAMQLFVSRKAFESEAAVYKDKSSPLQRFLPKLHAIIANEAGSFQDPWGVPMPPCIVIESGEPLDVWSHRSTPYKTMAYVVLYNIARAVSELHASGFVHRDIQPSNVIWLPRENRWSVISFRRTVRSGEYARVRYSLNYAAPEAIHADVNGKRSMLITPAIDAWSLGILAMELFTGTTVFDSSLNDHEVENQIMGAYGAKLPWEVGGARPDMVPALGVFKEPVLALLNRNPAQRPSMDSFCGMCNRLLCSISTLPHGSSLRLAQTELMPSSNHTE